MVWKFDKASDFKLIHDAAKDLQRSFAWFRLDDHYMQGKFFCSRISKGCLSIDGHLDHLA